MPDRSKGLFLATLVLACAQFARCYSTLTINYLSMAAYANGQAAMPYQGRMLMMWPIRWALNSPRLVRMTAGHEGAFRSPDALLITAVAFFCLLAASWIVVRWYRLASQRQTFAWVTPVLLLVILTVQYIMHSQNVMYPYDLPSMLMFTLSLFLIYTEQRWLMLVLFPFATLNREVTLFLIPLLMLDRYVAEGWKGLRRPALIAQVVLMCGMWVGLHVYVQHLFAGSPTEMGSKVSVNLHRLLSFRYYPQLAATGAFLLPFLWVYRQRILSTRLRAYLLVLVPWTAMMFFYGEIIETRLFGELSGLLAVTAVLAFEETL